MNKLILLSFILFFGCDNQPKKIVHEKQTNSSKENLIKEYEFDSLSNIYKNYKYAVSFKVPKSWEFDYGLTKNNFFRSYQKDSLYVTSALAWDYNFDSDINDLYEIVSKESFKDTLITKWKSQDLSIKPYDINLKKVYFRNKQAIKLEQKYLRHEEDFSFEITEWEYIYIRNGYRIQIGVSAPSVLIENNLVDLADFTSKFQDLPITVKSEKENFIRLIPRSGHKYIHTSVNGISATFMLDTGASSSTISTSFLDNLIRSGFINKSSHFKRKGIYYISNGDKVNVEVWELPSMRLGNKIIYNVEVAVMPGIDDNGFLLGMSTINKLGNPKIDLDNNMILMN
jgi:hypothetical protein